ncbi:phage/plasmid primase, P4 family [Lacipirellula parvula]|uniref:SF3 helicase domain-containing protein n=1 Tax=Lacipirellula parvula TaxID=2650471 RepID=A0A5K7XC99_9BACT|nr:phage/plasmid primase, P4 family [Lacipirellula parvula]BBO33647.1 hypothetical protein PLANPX_3259 [Lacipirellula parvula]
MSPAVQQEMEALARNNRFDLPLFPQHYAKLADECGLSPATILSAKIRSTGDLQDLAQLLNRKSVARSWGTAIVIPYLDQSGDFVLHRIRPTNPPVSKKTGKAQKYLQPTGAASRAYFPPSIYSVLDDASCRLIITEGEFKALKATQEGFPCIGLSGVDCWHPRKKLSLLPDLADIRWQGRQVFIAFDSDAIDNENVARNERELAATLKMQGAQVRIVRIPAGEGGKKVGLDDFLVAQGPDKFPELLENAAEPLPPAAGEFMESASDMDPAIEAAHILSTVKMGDLYRLRFWRGGWYWWANGRYGEKPPEEVRAEIVNLLNKKWLGVKSRNVSDVLEHVKAKSILPASVEPPSWLAAPPHGWASEECLATKNSVVHLPSLIQNLAPCDTPASPAFLTTSATDFQLDLNAPRPDNWLKFLDALWKDDVESIHALQEWFGYLLTHDTRQQKLMLLVGPKRSGKGTIARILTALVGKGNVAAPTLGGLATNFGLWPLIGKSVAIVSDARLSGRSDQAAVVERILSITGEDSITIDRKNMAPITVRLPTRFVILTNELPKLSDASGAIVSRVVLLHTTNSFYGKEDHDLTERLLGELPGILLWAIEGWRRLRERGRLLQPETGLESLGEMNDLASPVAAFVRDCCVVDRVAHVTPSDLYATWERWCKSQGREKFIGTVQSFARDLLAAEPSIRRKRVRDGDDRQRVYEGIGLKLGF